MFNHKYQIRPAFYLDHAALRRRFVACGIVHLVFLPFLLFFTTLHFGLQNAYDWKSTKKYLGPREWSLSSKWLFREFNELQHHFESRLYPSYEAAESYLALFGQSEIVAACGRILVFIGGSLGAVLFVFAAINDAILLHVRIADWNLLWYAGVVGVLYSVGKAMIPSEETRPRRIRNLYAETDAALTSIANHTHYYTPHWKGRAHDEATYKTIKSIYQYKAQLFLMEVASLLLAPYILCVSLAQNAESICEFIFLTKTDIAGAGDVCGYAAFDFDKFEDEAWEGRTMAMPANVETQSCSLSESVLRTRNLEEARRLIPVPKTCLGKMEKSFFSFKASHCRWRAVEPVKVLFPLTSLFA
jgi:autophagy-related protein 9